MRRSIVLFLGANALVLLYLVYQVWTLLGLLVADGHADAITRAEVPGPDSARIDERPQRVPKIIHQTYANESIPERWREPQASCRRLHDDYHYRLWTDALARELIASEYPWFLDTFDHYPYPIQRADAIRYFVLAHYGGIYIDLDDVGD